MCITGPYLHVSWKIPDLPDPGCPLITWACLPSSQRHPGPGYTEPLTRSDLQAMSPYFPAGWEALAVGCLRAEDDRSSHPPESYCRRWPTAGRQQQTEVNGVPSLCFCK